MTTATRKSQEIKEYTDDSFKSEELYEKFIPLWGFTDYDKKDN